MNEIIENVEFADNEYTRIRFVIVNEERGTRQLAELKVPDNNEAGRSKYWDMILDQFDIDILKQNRIDKINRHREILKERAAREKEKQEIHNESEALRNLFILKSNYIKLPFVKTEEDKSIIRKAPNELTLNFVIQEMMSNYIKQNNIDKDVFFDEIEDAMFEYGENNEST